MSTETIAEVAGPKTDADHANIFRRILGVDFVPRNSSGVATDIAGSLGTSALRWLNAHVENAKLHANGFITTVSAASDITSDYVLTLLAALPATKRPLLMSILNELVSEPITLASLGALNEFVSSASSYAANPMPTSFTDVTSLTGEVYVSGRRPIALQLINDSSSNYGYVNFINNHNSNIEATLAFLRNGTIISRQDFEGERIPPGCFKHVDLGAIGLAPGTYTYSVQVKGGAGTNEAPGIAFSNVKLIGYPL